MNQILKSQLITSCVSVVILLVFSGWLIQSATENRKAKEKARLDASVIYVPDNNIESDTIPLK